ncbi:MAG: hypothetical protein WA659_05995 [Candidatus Aquirickettsiella sp.]
MRIFNIKKVVTCALLDNSRPDLSKQSDKQPHYALNIYPYCENDSDSISIDSLKNTVKNLNVLCLQTPPEQNQFNLAHTIKRKPFGIMTKTVLVQTKKKAKKIVNEIVKPFIPYRNTKKKSYSKKNKEYLRQYQFNTSNSDSSFPIFLFYQHKAASEQLTQDLAKLLNNYWDKLDVNLIKNLSLSKADHKSEDQHDMIFNTEIDDPHLKILDIIADILNEIEKQFSVSILGIFLDPYFISKKDNKLIADNVVDKRSSRIIELAIHDTGNQQESCSSKQDTELLLSKIEINEHNNVSITNKSEFESSQKNVQSTSISVQPTYNCLITKEESSSNWNPEVKEKINNLLLSYTKHLSKKYFFRSNDQVTKSKKYITTDLLNKLNGYTPENFYNHVYGISTNDILNKHRDISIIQKIGQFFKRHNKTEGTLLLENIVSTLNENNTMITIFA